MQYDRNIDHVVQITRQDSDQKELELKELPEEMVKLLRWSCQMTSGKEGDLINEQKEGDWQRKKKNEEAPEVTLAKNISH